MSTISTKELSQEISKREGIKTITVAPYENVEIKIGPEVFETTGPAIILINQD